MNINIIIIILLSIIILLLLILIIKKNKQNFLIHNKIDIQKGMELQKRKDEYHKYLNSFYYDSIPPKNVREGYRKIEKEVLGYYLN